MTVSEIVFIAGKGLTVWGAATPSRSLVQGEIRARQTASRNDMRNRFSKRLATSCDEHNAASLFTKLRYGTLRGKYDLTACTPGKHCGGKSIYALRLEEYSKLGRKWSLSNVTPYSNGGWCPLLQRKGCIYFGYAGGSPYLRKLKRSVGKAVIVLARNRLLFGSFTACPFRRNRGLRPLLRLRCQRKSKHLHPIAFMHLQSSYPFEGYYVCTRDISFDQLVQSPYPFGATYAGHQVQYMPAYDAPPLSIDGKSSFLLIASLRFIRLFSVDGDGMLSISLLLSICKVCPSVMLSNRCIESCLFSISEGKRIMLQVHAWRHGSQSPNSNSFRVGAIGQRHYWGAQ